MQIEPGFRIGEVTAAQLTVPAQPVTQRAAMNEKPALQELGLGDVRDGLGPLPVTAGRVEPDAVGVAIMEGIPRLPGGARVLWMSGGVAGADV